MFIALGQLSYMNQTCICKVGHEAQTQTITDHKMRFPIFLIFLDQQICHQLKFLLVSVTIFDNDYSQHFTFYKTFFFIIIVGILFSKQYHSEFHHAAFRFAINLHNNRFNITVFNSVGPNSGPTTPAGTAFVRLVPIISQLESDNPFSLMHECKFIYFLNLKRCFH